MVDLEKKDSRCRPFRMVLWKHIQYCPLLLIEYTTVEKHKATPLQLTLRKLDLSFIYIESENCEINFHQEIHIQLFVSFYDSFVTKVASAVTPAASSLHQPAVLLG